LDDWKSSLERLFTAAVAGTFRYGIADVWECLTIYVTVIICLVWCVCCDKKERWEKLKIPSFVAGVFLTRINLFMRFKLCGFDDIDKPLLYQHNTRFVCLTISHTPFANGTSQ
jgi:hypothetical protein